MSPTTRAQALKHLSNHLEQLLALVNREIRYHQEVCLGTAICNHDHTTDHPRYHHRVLQMLDAFQEWAKKDLQDTNLLIWNIPYDVWTDPVEGPVLRYQMTMHDGVHFEHYGSEHCISEKTALTEPPDPYTIDKIRVTKIDKDFMRFVSSTRMTHVMWNEETEQDIEEAMDAHSRQMARQEQRKLEDAYFGTYISEVADTTNPHDSDPYNGDPIREINW